VKPQKMKEESGRINIGKGGKENSKR